MKTVQTAYGPFRAWDRDDITKSLELGEFWDAHLLPAINETPTDGWAIDLGANIGFLAVYFAKRFPHVLAVEAHPRTCDLLRENIDLHGCEDRVSVVCGAAYDRETTLELASSAIHGWTEDEQSFLDLDTAPHAAGFTFVEDPTQQHYLHEWKIPTVRVDDLVPPDVTVRLMKIDVQGAALRALYGSLRTIARCRPRIIFEFEKHVSECRGDMWGDHGPFFEDQGYDVFSIPGPWSDFLAIPR